MFANFDFDVIRRSLGYLFLDGMTFTLTLTGLGALGGLIFGTLLALMRLSGLRLLSVSYRGFDGRSHAGQLTILTSVPPAAECWCEAAFRAPTTSRSASRGKADFRRSVWCRAAPRRAPPSRSIMTLCS